MAIIKKMCVCAQSLQSCLTLCDAMDHGSKTRDDKRWQGCREKGFGNLCTLPVGI